MELILLSKKRGHITQWLHRATGLLNKGFLSLSCRLILRLSPSSKSLLCVSHLNSSESTHLLQKR
jgi:hypothetical protein